VKFEKKLIFLEHPRTGSTSVRHALRSVGGQPHKRHTKLRGKEPTMSVVRNPYDLLTSWWIIAGKDQTFAEFIIGCNDPFMVRNERLFYFLETDYILTFEYLETELNDVLHKLKIRQVRLPHHNPTKGKHDYRQYYDDKTRSLVAKRFNIEIERFGYAY